MHWFNGLKEQKNYDKLTDDAPTTNKSHDGR